MAVKGLWTSQRSVNGTWTFGFGGDGNEENTDPPSGPSYVLPKAAYMLLAAGHHIQPRVTVG
jgi:hypothetical protein